VKVQPIGILRSCFREKFGTPRQPHLAPGSTAQLTVQPEFLPEHSLDGLEGFSHVWLLAWFHLNTNKGFRPKIHPPRLGGKTIGIFASRTPHRPSPIALSLARLIKIEGPTLHLAGIDLVDGTPIIDVKPYVPDSDRPRKASRGWTQKLKKRPFGVSFSPEAERAARRAGVKGLLKQVLSLELRNPRDRSQMAEGKPLELLVRDSRARFSIKGGKAVVTAVEERA
jgi:tRNA (adenine37-N6)-methyltransferase